MLEPMERSTRKTEHVAVTRGSVITGIAYHFQANMGKEVRSNELMALTRCASSTVPNTITRLTAMGWEFTKPSKTSYRCIKDGKLIPLTKDFRLRRPKMIKDSEWLKQQCQSPNPVVASEVVTVSDYLSDGYLSGKQSTDELSRGDLLEIVFISRAGTVHAEDAEGRSYRVVPLD